VQQDSPRSTDSSDAFVSIHRSIVGLLADVLLRRLRTRDDRFLKHYLLIFDEQVHVVLALDDEDALALIGCAERAAGRSRYDTGDD
jgi:hypothetical protein